MKGLLTTFVYLSVALSLSLRASALELMLMSDSKKAVLLGGGASLIDRTSTKYAGKYDKSNAKDEVQIAGRLSGYPNGTVVYIFRDGNDQMKGIFAVLPQSERLVLSLRAETSTKFQSSVTLLDIPESLIFQFDSTEVWRKSESANVEYLGDILIASPRP